MPTKGIDRNTRLALIVAAATIIPLSMYDFEITKFLIDNNVPAFSQFMDRSIFSGESLGFSDVFTILMIAFALCYFRRDFKTTHNPNTDKRMFTQIELGFIVSTTIVITLAVHALKFGLGRARPYVVFAEGSTHQFTSWWLLGDHNPFRESFYSGSLPSGHAATVLTALSIAFVLGRRGSVAALPLKIMIWIMFLLMAIARCMSSHHWITDSYFSAVVAVAAVHYGYKNTNFQSEMRSFCQELRLLRLPALCFAILVTSAIAIKAIAE